MMSTCVFSFIFLKKHPFKKSSVSVEEDVMTREERVDMDAESTRITTRAIRTGPRLESMVGMMAS